MAPGPVVEEGSSAYSDLAARQLQSPWHEPYINPSPREIEYPLQ